jgi:hypothetical protein
MAYHDALSCRDVPVDVWMRFFSDRHYPAIIEKSGGLF